MTTTLTNLPIDLSQPQNLDIRYGKSWLKVIYNFFTADGQQVWTTKVHSKSIEFLTADGKLLGTCQYHNLKSDVDVHLEATNQNFTMTRNKDGMLNETKSFDFAGHHLTWKRAGKWKKSGLWNLTDEREQVIATIGHDDWKVHSRFEIVMPGMDPTFLLAVLITGMSELEYQRRLSANAAASSGSAAASAAISG